tara:strand:+ start:201 stop:632 length:432 start_codon:yes stop_codon:yes gene_type:complete
MDQNSRWTLKKFGRQDIHQDIAEEIFKNGIAERVILGATRVTTTQTKLIIKSFRPADPEFLTRKERSRRRMYSNLSVWKGYSNMEALRAYYAGTFHTQWYGLSFHGWRGTTLQYDKPGYNSSDWEELYEIMGIPQDKQPRRSR